MVRVCMRALQKKTISESIVKFHISDDKTKPLDKNLRLLAFVSDISFITAKKIVIKILIDVHWLLNFKMDVVVKYVLLLKGL